MTIYKAIIKRNPESSDSFAITEQSKLFASIEAAKSGIEEKTKLILPSTTVLGLEYKTNGLLITIKPIEVGE